MRSITTRLEALENVGKFKTDRERGLYLKYARKINPNIEADQMQRPDDYIRLAKNHFKPLFQ